MTILDRIQYTGSRQAAILDSLRSSSKRVAIYGAGVYAYVLLRYLVANSVAVAAVMVDGAYKVSEEFMGLKVITTEGALSRGSDYELVVGIANYPPAQAALRKLGFRNVHVIDVPDFLNIPAPFMSVDFVATNREHFDRAYGLFADELSRETYIAAINTKINEDLSYIKPYVRIDHLYFTSSEFPTEQDATLLDVGGFNGDSIREFNEVTSGRYRKIISLEPFPDSFEKLRRTVETLGLAHVVPVQLGAWYERGTLSFSTNQMNIDNRIASGGSETIEVDTIDAILDRLGERVTFVKMDINGAEYRALLGAQQTIRTCRPKIAVKMHVKEDFFRLPILLKEVAPDIRLYLRQRNFMSMMLVLYGVFDPI